MSNKQVELVKALKKNLKLKFYLFKDNEANRNTANITNTGFFNNSGTLYYGYEGDPTIYSGMFNGLNSFTGHNFDLMGHKYINVYVRLQHPSGYAPDYIDFSEANEDLVIVNGSVYIDDDFSLKHLLMFNPVIKLQLPKVDYSNGIIGIDRFIGSNINTKDKSFTPWNSNESIKMK